MNMQHFFFSPMLSGVGAPHGKIPLDRNTPRGLFRGEDHNSYLVCDHPSWRYAVVLKHTELPAFTVFGLGGLPADHGEYWGIGVTHFEDVRESVPHDVPEPGDLWVRMDALEMWVRHQSGKWYWQVIAHGKTNGRLGFPQSWAFVDVWDEHFFGVIKE